MKKIFFLFSYRNIPIYLFFVFYFLVSFGAGVGANYTFAPYLLFASFFCVYIYRGRTSVFIPSLMKPLYALGIITVIFSLNYWWFDYPVCSYIEYLSYSLLPYSVCFATYHYVKQGEKELYVMLFLFLLFFIVGFYRFFHETEMMILNQSDFSSNNMFYQVLMPIPILLLYKKKYMHIIFLLLAVYICIVSMKRSAMIAIAMTVIVYIYNVFFKGGLKFHYFIIGGILISFLFYRFVDFSQLTDSYMKTMERMSNITEDGASGRFDILIRFFQYDIFDGYFFFGNGYMGYHNKYPDVLYSHNDIVEIFYSFGIFGLLAFFVFFYRLLKRAIIESRIVNSISTSYVIALMYFVLYTFAGGCFSFVCLTLPFFSFIGLSQAYNYIEQK